MAKKKAKKKTTPRATGPARQTAPRKRRKSANGDAGANIEQLADQIVGQAAKGTDPALEIPIRSLSNVKFNVKSRLIEMGSNTQQRSLFNYGQAKRFMQTMLVASKCKELIDAGKSASITAGPFSGFFLMAAMMSDHILRSSGLRRMSLFRMVTASASIGRSPALAVCLPEANGPRNGPMASIIWIMR